MQTQTPRLLRRPLWIGGILLWLSCLLPTACLDDEVYSTAATDRLTFSCDTLSLDTIISGRASNTYTFEVYNPNDKAIRLVTVDQEQGSTSGFRVNVDGIFLENGHGEGFEVNAHDSIRVFLFANLPEQDSDAPVKATDRLRFTTEGGAVQEVVLQAWGQDIIPLEQTTIDHDSVLSGRRPYLITDSLVVADDATLTLHEGVTLYFHPQARLVVHGRLVAEGSLRSPVMMRGDRLGYMFSQQAYDRIPGQWGGIEFTQESYGNRLNYCDIHSGTTGIVCDSSDVSREKLRIENSMIHNMSEGVLTVRMANVFVGNSQLSNGGAGCVTLMGGNSTFVHCTIANFYAFSSDRGVALTYTNYDGAVRLPLYGATFKNCIVTGYSEDEIMATASERYTDDAFLYEFDHCLLNTPEVTADGIRSCLWDDGKNNDGICREKNFFPDFDLTRLIFTFGLNNLSPAVNAADAAISRQYYPTDRNGNSRLSDTAPDMGCYERLAE